MVISYKQFKTYNFGLDGALSVCFLQFFFFLTTKKYSRVHCFQVPVFFLILQILTFFFPSCKAVGPETQKIFDFYIEIENELNWLGFNFTGYQLPSLLGYRGQCPSFSQKVSQYASFNRDISAEQQLWLLFSFRYPRQKTSLHWLLTRQQRDSSDYASEQQPILSFHCFSFQKLRLGEIAWQRSSVNLVGYHILQQGHKTGLCNTQGAFLKSTFNVRIQSKLSYRYVCVCSGRETVHSLGQRGGSHL